MSTPEEVVAAIREMTGQAAVIGEAIARHVGLRPADLEVLGAIEQHGPLTAGQLGKLTGLSAAAVTGLIDRLERAGVAARRHDDVDRRRVMVRISQGAMPIAEMYESLHDDTMRVLAARSPEELRVIAEFLREMHEIGVAQVARLERPGEVLAE